MPQMPLGPPRGEGAIGRAAEGLVGARQKEPDRFIGKAFPLLHLA